MSFKCGNEIEMSPKLSLELLQNLFSSEHVTRHILQRSASYSSLNFEWVHGFWKNVPILLNTPSPPKIYVH